MSAAAVRLRFRSRMNPSQWRAWQSDSRWTAFLGGWGSGKTYAGARIHLRNVVANPPGVDSLLVAPFWATIHRTTLREFLRTVPRKLITAESKKEHFVEVLGRRVYYGSADQPETLDGPTVGSIWVDEGRYVTEVGKRVIFSRLRAKQATQVRGLVTSTPGGPWLESEFGEEKPGKRYAVHASTRENARNLASGTIEDMETSLSARAAKVYIDGHFGLLEGAVYEFDKARHLIPWKYRPDLPVVVAWDFGWQRPAVLFLQPVPGDVILPPVKGTKLPRRPLPGSWVVFDELVPDELSTEVLAHRVKQRGYRIAKLYCDPAGDASQPALGLNDTTILRQVLGIAPEFKTAPRLRHLRFGISLVEAMLGNVRGETRLFVAEHLEKTPGKRGLVKDIGAYRYAEAKDGRPLKDEPQKDGLHDHTMDALRYFAVNEAVTSGRFHESQVM